MIIEGNKNTFFNDLLSKWKTANQAELDDIEKWDRQYHGDNTIDPLPGSLAEPDHATVVCNVTYELIESEVSGIIPSPNVKPKLPSDRNRKNAEKIEYMLKSIRDELPYEELNDLEERLTYVHGASIRSIDWDNTYITHNTIGRPNVEVMDIRHLIWQPGIYDIQSMDAIFIRYDTTIGNVMEKYGVSYDDALNLAGNSDDENASLDTEESVSVYVSWYKDGDGNVCKYVFCDAVTLEDIEDYWSRTIEVCEDCGEERSKGEDIDNPGHCRCGGKYKKEKLEYEEIDEDIYNEYGEIIIPAMTPMYREGKLVTEKVNRPVTDENGNMLTETINGITVPLTELVEQPKLEKTKLPWYKPNVYPIAVRVNVSRNESLIGQSDCEAIRPQQQKINKCESRAMEKKMSDASYPVKPDRSMFVYDKSLGNKVLTLPAGDTVGNYGAINITHDATQERVMSQDAYNQAKLILGITNSYQGVSESTSMSGIAKQIMVQQTEGRLASKRIMKNAYMARCDEAIFKLMLAYSDEPRNYSYIDEFGAVQNSRFSRYDYVDYDEKTGEYYYNDEYLFSTDMSGGSDTNDQQMWELISADYASGLYGIPGDNMTLLRMWMAREKAHYPNAHEQVNWFSKLVKLQAEQVQQAQSNVGATALPTIDNNGGDEQ